VGEGLKALAPRLTEAQAQQAIVPVLQRIGQTTNPDVLWTLSDVLKALAAELTEPQPPQVIAPLLQQIGETTDPDVLRALAEALQALAPKRIEAQIHQGLIIAMSSLGWAATEDQAVDWARALVAFLPADQGEARNLVTAIVYPFAAGPATDVLLDAIRARHPDAPAKEAGTAASLAWIGQKYPDQIRRPICPTPPQPTSLSGLKCPVSESEAPSYSAASSPKDARDTTERRK
jgi:hypothetical protein